MMNYPGVLAGDPEVLAKITAAGDRIIDGHGAGLSGDGLNTYRLAGIATDHECINAEEAKERIRLGMYVAIREGTAARNLESLLPAVNRDNWWYFMFCTDDRHLEDIMTDGHIDHCIRKAIDLGLDPVTALRMATINTARCYNLKGQGAVAPGYRGDLAVVDGFNDFNVEIVYVMGQKVAEKGRMLVGPAAEDSTAPGGNSINMAPLGADAFQVKAESPRVPVIRIIPGSIATGSEYVEMDVGEDGLTPPSGSDILKVAVVERHRATGNVSTAFISGLGFRNGAIASSVAHDSHNIIVVGNDDLLMIKAVKALSECGGGYCVVDGRDGNTLCLPLPVGGLMTDRPAGEVRKKLGMLLEKAKELGVPEGLDPFITLSFMALPVIPSLKITDKGIFDVNSFKFVDW